ncbi:hypothetical protein FKM82_024867 [Ascaphus truei]
MPTFGIKIASGSLVGGPYGHVERPHHPGQLRQPVATLKTAQRVPQPLPPGHVDELGSQDGHHRLADIPDDFADGGARDAEDLFYGPVFAGGAQAPQRHGQPHFRGDGPAHVGVPALDGRAQLAAEVVEG